MPETTFKIAKYVQKSFSLVVHHLTIFGPALGWKGSIKQCVSILLGIGLLVFSETQHAVRGPYIVVCDRAECFGKNLYRAKMVKNDPKRGFLEFLRKSCHQLCLEFVLNEIFYGSLIFCEKYMLRKNLVLKLQPKMSLDQ